MTFTANTWAVDGGPIDANLLRLQLNSSTRGDQGIIGSGDLRVTALTVPGSSVNIADGACVIRGNEVQWQGSYYGYNIGTATAAITPTTGSARSDLIVVRAEDPTFSGSSWTHNPATDVMVDVRVIQGVSSSATTAPSGSSAIALARIDIPASTSAITQAMVVDLRKMMSPRRDRTLATYSPTASTSLTTRDNNWYTRPTTLSLPVSVPTWATQVKVVLTCAGLRLSGATNIFGAYRFIVGSSLTGQSVNVDDNQGTVTRRQTLMVADTLAVPAAYRGTTQQLQAQFQLSSSSDASSNLTWDGATTFVADVEFNEIPTYDL